MLHLQHRKSHHSFAPASPFLKTRSGGALAGAVLGAILTRRIPRLLFLEELLSYFDDKPGVYLELEMKPGNKTL